MTLRMVMSTGLVRRYGSLPTWLHSILQALLAEVLTWAGYTAGSELELRIDPDWEPKPDVSAALKIEQPYPTRPIDIVAEVLSPGDDMHTVHEKCEQYARIGIFQILCSIQRPRRHGSGIAAVPIWKILRS